MVLRHCTLSGCINLDDLLAYETVKIVEIKDRTLGAIHWGFSILM